jgi:hypothetical protein
MHNKNVIKKHLLTKHTQLQPSPERLALIQHILHLIESELKSASDRMLADSKPESVVVSDKDSEKYRHLTGVFRVGQLEKGTLLAVDADFEVIVLFDRHPRVDMIKRVIDELVHNSQLLVKQEKETLDGFDRERLKMSAGDEETLLRDAAVVISYELKDENPIRFKLAFSTLSNEEKEDTEQDDITLKSQVGYIYLNLHRKNIETH